MPSATHSSRPAPTAPRPFRLRRLDAESIRDTPLLVPGNLDTKRLQWQGFLTRSKLVEQGMSLPVVVNRVRRFLRPPTDAIRREEPFDQTWEPGGPWGDKPPA